ncbi:MAG: type IV secretion system DNA-binding domain-containing protein [Patescibacteria group bacterium]|nr:type IV secretion system DNA-binding domain-containing protein [Patescibacteria group bacterium]
MLFQPVFIAIIFVLAATTLFFVFKKAKTIRLLKSLDLRLLSIRLSQKSKKDSNQTADWKDEINATAQLASILSGLNTPFSLEAAVHHIGEEIHFYVGVPKNSLETVSRQIEGLFKNAQIEPVDDYNIFSSSGENTGVFLKQKYSYALPVRTYMEANIDTFAPILSAFSKINEIGEGGAIQILAKLAPKSAKKSLTHIISRLKQGAKAEEVLQGPKITFQDIKKAALGTSEKNKEEKTIINEEAVKSVEAKISKPLLLVNIRALASAPSPYQANAILEGITHGFSQFTAPLRQEFKIIKPRDLKKFFYQYSFRYFNESDAVILNTEELASIFHLPTSSTDIPNIKWVHAKEAIPPNNLLREGTLIGESAFRRERKQIYIGDEDRKRHIYIIGQTGTGKSTLMVNMAADDIKKGKGIAIIDPHGELIESVLNFIPQHRADDVIIFDPGDLIKPLGMNIFEYDFNKPEQKTFIVNEMFSILDKLYDMKVAGGPMFEQYTKNAILLLMEDMANEPATLMEIPRIFTDSEFRNRKLARIANPTVIDFWEKEAVKASGEHSLANMSAYITSKFNNFISNDYLRPIIGQPKSAFNFRQIMDGGKILLVNLSKGKIGDINANLLGMIVVGKILMAALSRVDTEQKNRRDFNLFIDEFQNFSTDSISAILSEARKYGLNITVAHQFIAQLTEKIRDAIFGNVGSKIVFRVGVQDAEFLVKEFEPVFDQNDLINIANFNAYIKMLVNGQTTNPFNIKTIPFGPGNEGNIEKLKELSRLKYGRERREVEEEILKRLRG